MDSEISERLRKLQLADLGSSRRDHISTDDNKVLKSKTSSEAVLKAIEASRESNKSGSAAHKLAKKNEAKIEGWTSLHTKIGDIGGLELLDDMLDGQTHRLKMGVNTSIQYSEPSKNGNNTARKPSGKSAGSKRPAPTPEPSMSTAGDSHKVRKGAPQRNPHTVPTKRRRPMEDFSRCISSPEDFLAYARSMRETQTSIPVSKSESNVSRTEPDFKGVETAKLACPPLPPVIKEMFSKNAVSIPPPRPLPTTNKAPEKAPVVSPASTSGSHKELPKRVVSAPQPASTFSIGEIPKASPSSEISGIPVSTSAALPAVENGPPKKIKVSLPKVSPSEPSKISPASDAARALALIASATLMFSSNQPRPKDSATTLAQANISTTSGMLKRLASDTLAGSSSMVSNGLTSCEAKEPGQAASSTPSNFGTESVSTSELSKSIHAAPFVPTSPSISTRNSADTTSKVPAGSGCHTPSMAPASLPDKTSASASTSTPSRASIASLPPVTFKMPKPAPTPVSVTPNGHPKKVLNSGSISKSTPSSSTDELSTNVKPPAAVGILVDLDAPQKAPSTPQSPGVKDLMGIDFQTPAPQPAPLKQGARGTILGNHNLPGRRNGAIAGGLGDSIYADVPGVRRHGVLS